MKKQDRIPSVTALVVISLFFLVCLYFIFYTFLSPGASSEESSPGLQSENSELLEEYEILSRKDEQYLPSGSRQDRIRWAFKNQRQRSFL